MNPTIRTAPMLFMLSLALTGCGSGGNSNPEAPLNTDYSKLKVAASREGALVQAKNADAVLNPLRNGVRLSLNPSPSTAIVGLTAPNAATQAPYSATTIQVDGVDEADLVKYDGDYIYSVRPEVVPTKPGFTRNVLKIAKTNPANATLEVTAEYAIEGEQSTLPVIYDVQSAAGDAEFIAAVSQNFGGWLSPLPHASLLVAQPDRTKVQLLDVRDPYNVSQAWQLELDGWLRGTRKIGNALYLVNSYRPRLADLILPADTQEKKEANERRIRNASAQELMPKVRVNGGAAQSLALPDDCVIAADLASDEAYTDLLVITTVDLNTRTISDVACTSTNLNGLYVSRDSLYIGGEGSPGTPDGSAFTVLHKFALEPSGVTYRASGVVGGQLPWWNASYFMDEHGDRLRIVTSQHSITGNPLHRLSVLQEATNQELALLSVLPSPEHPEPIGKPGDQVHAVRFLRERAYVVTARAIDPLYVIDVSDPLEPFIAGELEIPGFATHLQPLEIANTELLLSVGRQTNTSGAPQGVKVELFDVSDIALPRSLGAQVFGQGGSSSEAIGDPHALTVMRVPGETPSYRIGLPIDVYTVDTTYRWDYSGFHFLEVSSTTGSPQLRVHGVLKTEESSSPGSYPSHTVPRRVVMHGDAMYGVHGGVYISSLWDVIAP